MRIVLRKRQTFLLFVLALVVLGVILLNAVAHIHGWQIMSPLKAEVPGAMYGGGLKYGG
ncbi:MAG TPA: hypothetical protein VH593_07950 [Ktedonobacteraceae bacterium]|jgi:hypothetical protein